jgi:hypothetical protein
MPALLFVRAHDGVHEQCDRGGSEMRRALALSICALGWLLLSQTSLAAFAQQPGERKPNNPPPKPDPHQYDTKAFEKSAPSLPHIPDYTGVQPKFDGGHWYPNLHRGQCFAVSYFCRERPDQVYYWYSQALAGNGWTIDQKRSTATKIIATRTQDGELVTVGVGACANPPFKATVSIREMIDGPPRVTNPPQ